MKLHKLSIFVTSIPSLLNVFNIIFGLHWEVQIQFLVRQEPSLCHWECYSFKGEKKLIRSLGKKISYCRDILF